MLLKDLTKEQKEKICNHFLDEIPEEDTSLASVCKACSKCPFSLETGEGGWTECCAWVLFEKLPQELEEVIKDEV